jgi:hypothetical protein
MKRKVDKREENVKVWNGSDKTDIERETMRGKEIIYIYEFIRKKR